MRELGYKPGKHSKMLLEILHRLIPMYKTASEKSKKGLPSTKTKFKNGNQTNLRLRTLTIVNSQICNRILSFKTDSGWMKSTKSRKSPRQTRLLPNASTRRQSTILKECANFATVWKSDKSIGHYTPPMKHAHRNTAP